MPHKTGETECVRTIMLLVPLYLGQEGSFNVYYLWSKRGEAIRREGDGCIQMMAIAGVKVTTCTLHNNNNHRHNNNG